MADSTAAKQVTAGGAPEFHVGGQAAVLAFLAVYVPLSGWRMDRRLGLYLVGLYILSQVPPVCFHKLSVADAVIVPCITAFAHLPGGWSLNVSACP